MAEINIGTGTRQIFADALAAVTALTVDAQTPVAASVLSGGPYGVLSYTIHVTTNDIKWEVFGANLATFTDEISVQSEATVVIGANGSYTATPAPFRFYRVKVRAAVSASQGNVQINAVAR